MAQVFPGDRYDTQDSVKKALREYLLLGTRWGPYSCLFQIIFRYRPRAKAGTYDDATWAQSSVELMHYLESCGARFHFSGMDNIDKLQGPAVFVSNHMSTMETLVLPGIIASRIPATYVVKEKLVKGLVWGPIMRSRDPIVVTRTDPRRDLETVLSEGQRILGSGKSIIIFPQGTRKDIFTREGFNSLGVKLASKAQVPVVPVAVKTDFWGNSPLLRGFGPVDRRKPVYIKFGEAFLVEGRGKAEHERTLEFIESNLREWGAPVK